MKTVVCIETSIISYLAARPSRDLIVAAHQQVTQEWWEFMRGQYECITSTAVVKECSAGDPQAATRRLGLLQEITIIAFPPSVMKLAVRLIERGALPQKAIEDATHIAAAATCGVHILLTWNCKHIANAAIQRSIERVLLEEQFAMPVICTPLELRGE
jgi:hypothetical protein